jgi:hypothetical protein
VCVVLATRARTNGTALPGPSGRSVFVKPRRSGFYGADASYFFVTNTIWDDLPTFPAVLGCYCQAVWPILARI